MKTAFGDNRGGAAGVVATLALAVLTVVLAITSAPAGAAPLPGDSSIPRAFPSTASRW